MAIGTGFADLNLPPAEEFANRIKELFEADLKQFLGYAVPVTVTALFIRSALK